MLYHHKDIHGKHTPLIAEDVFDIIMKNKTKLNDVIDYDRDYLFDFFGYKTLERAYLMRLHGKVVERIQHMWMRVSVGIHKGDIKSAIQSYEMMSRKYFTHATPTLFHAGTPKNQFSSCFLMGMEDSTSGIYKAIADMAQISAGAGGIGVAISNIRSTGSYIRGSNGKSNGIIPLCRVMNETARHINQSGKRPGSIAVYIEPHHPDILEFLELRKNTGAEHLRARDLFLAMWIPDLFMKRLLEPGSMWSLMDPDECPGLNDVYGDEYEALYMKYEMEKKYRKRVATVDIWNAILTSQIETGTPYIAFKDHVNRKSAQQNIGIIRNSNLCCEICLYSDDKEYAVCTLASVGLPMFVNEETREFDYEKLVDVMAVIVKNLNRVIDYNYYPTPETRRSNMRTRPLGIGTQGLSDCFMKMRLPYDSEEAKVVNRQIAESMYYGALKASMELAKEEKMTYEMFKGSPMSEGVLQFDMWGVSPSDRYDWKGLKEEIREHGLMNSTLIALMPTASTSQILGNTECFEPITSNIYTRSTIAGDFVVINKFLVKDLIQRGMWNKEMKDAIIAENGSIQGIDEIPMDLKNLYKTVWEIKQKVLIDLSVDRGPYVCQTQSLNLFFEEPDSKKLTSALSYGWKNGLKTGSYYIRSRPKVQAQQFTIDPSKKKESAKATDYQVCEVCSA
jgi:ribonucleoside-diphosphate reductase alpha chain